MTSSITSEHPLDEWSLPKPTAKDVDKMFKKPPITTGTDSLFSVLGNPDVVDAYKKEILGASTDEVSTAWQSTNLERRLAFLNRRAWDVALNPVKTLAMQVVMMYFMGSGGIFGFILLGYAIMQAVRILMAVTKTFDDLQASAGLAKGTPGAPTLLLQRAAYVALALLMCTYFVYQAAKIGMLPVGTVDVSDDIEMLSSTGVPATLIM